MKKLLGAVVLLAFFATDYGTADASAADTDAKLDYQKLVGSWEWNYPIGYSTLTIENVAEFRGNVYAFGSYDVSSRDNTVSGRRVTGTIDLQGERNKLVFKGYGTLELWWNGGGRLWGSCMFKTWSGDCEYSKK
jgi:hypothetical protein